MKLIDSRRRAAGAFALALLLGSTPAAALACGGGMTSKQACATTWGSLAKQQQDQTGKQVHDVRSGQHHCFDRLVIDVGGAGKGALGYYVSYVTHVTKDGSGDRVPLRGGAQLQVVVNAPAYDATGDVTYEPAHPRELVQVDGYRTFRQVAWAGTFEGQTIVGLGVRARLPVRVFVLSGSDGSRLVVDVAHRWS